MANDHDACSAASPYRRSNDYRTFTWAHRQSYHSSRLFELNCQLASSTDLHILGTRNEESRFHIEPQLEFKVIKVNGLTTPQFHVVQCMTSESIIVYSSFPFGPKFEIWRQLRELREFRNLGSLGSLGELI